MFMLSACVRQPQTVSTIPTPVISAPSAPAEVVHTARYTLVSLAPEEALRYPLRQIASHTVSTRKKGQTPTRGDALHVWLSGTGYGLCLPVTDDARQLFNSPLPDVWRTPGPRRVETALQTIAGPAWVMNVDEMTRVVCFVQAPAIKNLS
jgi:type IV pili sensor histidine kinase/response regulator